jgi:hypothetical protein
VPSSLRLVLAVVGGALTLAVLWSILASLVVPRAHRSVLVRSLDRSIEAVYGLLSRPLRTWEAHDRLLASQGAVEVLGTLVVWVALLLVGGALLLEPATGRFPTGLAEVAAAMGTLSLPSHPDAWTRAVCTGAAFTGMAVIALQIAYLPTLYAAYNRRETLVTLLAASAGLPPWGPELLARTRVGFVRQDLAPLYSDWERWAADVAESHTTYPVLLRFRSPRPTSSWLVGLLAVLDAAALHLSLAPSSAPVEARLCLRMGFTCLQDLAETVGTPVDRDPRPDQGIELTEAEFAEGVARLAEVGFPIERPPAAAWRDFQGWRVNYEPAAYALARRLTVVPAPWTGDRRRRLPEVPVRTVRNRTPEDPEGRRTPARDETGRPPGP